MKERETDRQTAVREKRVVSGKFLWGAHAGTLEQGESGQRRAGQVLSGCDLSQDLGKEVHNLVSAWRGTFWCCTGRRLSGWWQWAVEVVREMDSEKITK